METSDIDYRFELIENNMEIIKRIIENKFKEDITKLYEDINNKDNKSNNQNKGNENGKSNRSAKAKPINE